MNKIGTVLVFAALFLSFAGSAFAAYDFDYFFGYLLQGARPVNAVSFGVPTPTPAPTPTAAQNPIQDPSALTQISSMQASLRQMSLTLASLNSNLAKPNSVIVERVEKTENNSKLAFGKGIPLLLPGETKKEEEKTQSTFASLIPPDVRNFPWIVTFLTVLILLLSGMIAYLIFLRRRERQTKF